MSNTSLNRKAWRFLTWLLLVSFMGPCSRRRRWVGSGEVIATEPSGWQLWLGLLNIKHQSHDKTNDRMSFMLNIWGDPWPNYSLTFPNKDLQLNLMGFCVLKVWKSRDQRHKQMGKTSRENLGETRKQHVRARGVEQEQKEKVEATGHIKCRGRCGMRLVGTGH